MSFDELYQEIILQHARSPLNSGELPDATHKADGDNPSCGDEISVHLILEEDGSVKEIKFTGHSCAICTASASLMTKYIQEKSPEEIQELISNFCKTVGEGDSDVAEKLDGDLKILVGVHHFPQRVKCATLPWHTLKAALTSPSP